MVLSEYANEPIDVAKTMCMVLTHDLVEIDAGDTYAYDTKGNETKRERNLRLQTGSMGCFLPIRGRIFGNCGMSLKPWRRRRRGLPMRWTRSSRSF